MHFRGMIISTNYRLSSSNAKKVKGSRVVLNYVGTFVNYGGDIRNFLVKIIKPCIYNK